MRIGLVTGEYPPMRGGVAAFTQKLAHTLAAAGHEIFVITSREAKSPEPKRSLWEVAEPIEGNSVNVYPRVGRWWWSAMSLVSDVVIRHRLEVVNLQFQAAAYDMRVPAISFLPWRLRDVAPIVVTFHDLRVPYLFPKAGRLRKWVVHRLARSADGVISTNAGDREELQLAGVDKRRLACVPIGSNINPGQPSVTTTRTVRDRLGLAKGDRLIGYFGFLSESKGADLLLQALSEIDESFHVVFIGSRSGGRSAQQDQSFAAKVERLMLQLGLSRRVHWTDYLTENEVSIYLHAVDFMVMPFRDGASLRRGTLMAALAHGCPLITTEPTSSVPELIHGQNVWLTPVDDLEGLKDAMELVAFRPELRARLAAGASQAASAFSWEAIAEQTVTFFDTIVDGVG